MQIEELFHRAAECEPEERVRLLEAAGGTDPALRREVESLLARDGSADGRMRAAVREASDFIRFPLLGRTVSHYQVLEALGVGGMGVVYKARDTKLPRFVALKFLPQHLSQNRDALERFKREAQAVSSLNHANICTIYHNDEYEGQPFIVMELIEGETLSQRIARGPLPLKELFEIALQICKGLAAAHARGIVHRDIKPSNIVITTDGVAKILDFGVAKLQDPVTQDPVTKDQRPPDETGAGRKAPPVDLSMASDLTLTLTGAAMGTAAYMSPEQARGEELDARTDLFSFGVVLYEMATGRRAFNSDAGAGVNDAILNRAPQPLRRLNPEAPRSLETVINKVIEKNRGNRCQSAAEIRVGLLRAQKEARARPGHKVRLAAGVAVAAAAALAYIFWPALPPPQLSPAVQLTFDGVIKPEDMGTLATDGNRLYFNEWPSGVDAETGLFEIPVTGGDPAPIPVDIVNPVLADIQPDQSGLLVLSAPGGVVSAPERKLFLVALHSGGARPLRNILAHAATFSPDGTKIAYASEHDLYLANADGSDPQKLLTAAGAAWDIRWSPEGERLRFHVSDTPGGASVLWEAHTDGSGGYPLLPDRSDLDQCCGFWTQSSRYYVFQWIRGSTTRNGVLWAVRDQVPFFRRSRGTPMQLSAPIGDIEEELPSLDGRTLFADISSWNPRLVRFDRKQRQFVPYLGGIAIQSADFSRDGQWAVYSTFKNNEIWRSRLDGTAKIRLVPSCHGEWPRWSPDGKQIAFFGCASRGAYIAALDGRTPPRPISGIPADSSSQLDWSPDGKRLVLGSSLSGEPTREARILDLDGGNATVIPGSGGLMMRWSPDGRHIAGASRNLGALMLFDMRSQKWRRLATVPGKIVDIKWSTRADYIYWLETQQRGKRTVPLGIFRMRPNGRAVERVANLASFTLQNQSWLGLAPDDSVVVSQVIRADDIYALGWREP